MVFFCPPILASMRTKILIFSDHGDGRTTTANSFLETACVYWYDINMIHSDVSRAEGAGKSGRIAPSIPVAAKNIHRTRLSQIMERPVLLHVDVRSYACATTISRYSGGLGFRLTTAQFHTIY